MTLSILDLIIPKSLRKITSMYGIENFRAQAKSVLQPQPWQSRATIFARYPYFTLNNLFIYQYLMIIISVDADCTL